MQGLFAVRIDSPNVLSVRSIPLLDVLRPAPVLLLGMVTAVSFLAIAITLLRLIPTYRDRAVRGAATLIFLFIALRSGALAIRVFEYWFPLRAVEMAFDLLAAVVAPVVAYRLVRMLPKMTGLPTVGALEREVAARRKAEQEALANEHRLRSFLESVEDYAIYMIDTQGLVVSWNRGAERIKGYTAEEIVGRHFSCFYTAKDIAARKPEEALRTAAETGRFEGEAWRTRKDGSRFWANVILRPVLDDDGVLAGFSKVTRDLTESRAHESRYQTLLEAVPDAIVIVEGEGRIGFVNGAAERVFGYSRGQMIGSSVQMLNPPRVQEAQTAYLRKLFEDPRNPEVFAPGEILGLRKDGSEFPLEFSVSPLDTREGRKLLFAIRDLTDRRRMDQRFKAVLNAAPDGILVIDRSSRIQLVNDRIETLFGYSLEELIGQDAAILAPEELRVRMRERHARFFRDPDGFTMDHDPELSALRKDGSRFYAEANFRPFESADGIAAVVTVRDVSERKKSEMRFWALLESAPDAVLLIGAGGAIEFANANVERLYGYALSEVIGQPADFLTPVRHAAETSQFLREVFLRDADSQPVESRFAREEYSLHGRRKNGSEFPADVRIRLIKTDQGPMVYANIRDISAIKLAETRFRSLLESAPDGILVLDNEGRIEFANCRVEEQYGYTREELQGRSFLMLSPERLHVDRKRQFQELVESSGQSAPGRSEEVRVLEVAGLRKDGSEFPAEISVGSFNTLQSVEVFVSIRDISDRKLAAQQLVEKMTELRHSNEQLEQFAHIASHDLQEPLRMVASYTQLLAKRYKGRLDPDADEFIGYAVDGTQRMKQLIEALLEYSRTGKGSPPVRQFASELALKQALATLRVRIEESGAEVTHDPLPVITASDETLVQIFQNLVGNAIKYRGDRIPQIHISSVTTSEEWIFSVADNGIGIDPRYFEKIFLIFQRLHSQDEYEGTGIGLAICHRILHRQGGRIWVESEPGQGSTFYFALPVCIASPAANPQPVPLSVR